jgi:hypothetical protein
MPAQVGFARIPASLRIAGGQALISSNWKKYPGGEFS